jgi:threonine aldolase
MASALFTASTRLGGGVDPGPPPAVNSVFPVLPASAIAPLQAWSFFWDWDRSIHQVRWMTAWDTTDEDVATFIGGVGEIVATCN